MVVACGAFVKKGRKTLCLFRNKLVVPKKRILFPLFLDAVIFPTVQDVGQRP